MTKQGNKNYRKSGTDKKSETTEKTYMFSPKTQGTSLKYASFASIKERIAQQAQKKYKFGSDVAKSIKDEKKLDLDASKPKIQVSKKADDYEREVEQKMFDIDYQEAVRRHMDRKEQLDENMKKLYTEIFTVYCTTSMQQRLEEHPNFDKFEDDPIATLEVIRNTTHETIRAQYPLVTIVDSVVRWMNARQGEDEDLIAFTKRVKQLSDVVKSMIGTKILHNM